MLVLSRERDGVIMIGDDIRITVVDIRGDKVRLGITAPTNVPVHRLEVYEAIKREPKQSRLWMLSRTTWPSRSAKLTDSVASPPTDPSCTSSLGCG